MRKSFYWRVVFIVVFIFFISNVIVSGIAFLVIRSDMPSLFENHVNLGFRFIVFISSVCSLLIATFFTILLVKRMVQPVTMVSDAAKEIAGGNFEVRLAIKRKDEIGELAQNFNIMAAELRKIEVLRNDFVSSVSHEFRTPLVSIEGYARLLKSENLSSEQVEYVDTILSEVDRLSRMSNNILLLNRLENENYDNAKTEFDLDEQIRKAILLLENDWSQKQIELNLDLKKMKIMAIKDLIMQVWLNLIANAIKFSPPGQQLDITLGEFNDLIVFRTRNFGDVITEEDLRHIFDKFYQGDKSRNREGNGLGLSICKKIVELHHGNISVKSDAANGTEFIVIIPQS